MSDTPSSDQHDSVLRPFQPPEHDPLPPVEASSVVSEERAPEMPEHITPEDVVNAPGAPPIEGQVPDLGALVDESDDESERVEVVDPLAVESSGGSNTLTLAKKPFMVGLALVAVAMLALVALWQGAGDGETGTASPGPLVDGGPGEGQPSGEGSTDSGASAAGDGTDVASLNAEIESLTTEMTNLSDEVTTLQSRLQEQPIPALPGQALVRISVPAGAKFVSARAESVAVVGPFGGLAFVDPDTNLVTATGSVSTGATRVIRTSSSAWITNYAGNQLIRVDPAANVVAEIFDFPGPDGLAKYEDSLLVASFDEQFVAKVDPSTGEIVARADLGGQPTDVLVSEDHGVWVALFDTGELVRIDPESMEVIDRVVVGAGPVGLTSTRFGVWAANHSEGTVALVDASLGEVVSTIAVGDGPSGMVGYQGQLWVTVTDNGELVQIDMTEMTIVTRTALGGPALGGGPVGISYVNGSLWIAMDREDSVVRVVLPG